MFHETTEHAFSLQGRGAYGELKDIVSISWRPAEVEDRAIPGHWEGDLTLGRGRKSQIATIVERPEQLRCTLTWDKCKGMATHASSTVATDIAVSCCDPRSHWQRGTNQYTN